MKTLFGLLVAGLLSGLASMAAAFGPLVSVEEIGTADRVIDIRAPRDFLKGHVPDAVNAPYGAWRGPKQNPGRLLDIEALEALLEGLGLEPGQKIVVAHEGRNATDFGAAARVYWTLKSAGFTELAILNGGYNAWTRAGNVPHGGPVSVAASDLDISFDPAWNMDTDEVEAVVTGQSRAVLIDARPAEFFQGKKKHGAAKAAGTLAGALNIVHSTWFGDDKNPVIDAPEDLLQQVRDLAAENPDAPLVSFCNTGHWAATNWFAVSELAGVENVKLYPESMVGWTLLGKAVTAGQ